MFWHMLESEIKTMLKLPIDVVPYLFITILKGDTDCPHMCLHKMMLECVDELLKHAFLRLNPNEYWCVSNCQEMGRDRILFVCWPCEGAFRMV